MPIYKLYKGDDTKNTNTPELVFTYRFIAEKLNRISCDELEIIEGWGFKQRIRLHFDTGSMYELTVNGKTEEYTIKRTHELIEQIGNCIEEYHKMVNKRSHKQC
jgi:hypothetical protein